MRKTGLGVLGICALIAGCPDTTPPPPPPEAVLAGDWTLTPADPGDFDDVMYEATFGEDGQLTEIRAERADGATAKLDTSGATTTLDGDEVSISIPVLTGTRAFDGILSADQNTIVGMTNQEIDLGGLEINVPGGELTFNRIIIDPCDGVTCDEGETCVDGECEADDLCDGIDCEEGETCVDGVCEADDPCDGITCEEGETCVDGVCEADDPCEGMTCETCEECVDGTCVPLVGDAAAGETYYNNNCAGCHGADGTGGSGGPTLADVDCARIFDKLSGVETHGGDIFPDATEQDAADVDAWLDSL